MKFPRKHAIDPQGRLYLLWLFLVTCCYTYNAWSIFLRAAFSHHQTAGNLKYWLTFDYLSDLVYLLDILLIKMHIVYLDEGIFIDDRKMMMKNYLGKIDFKLDVASLVPLDIFYFVTGVKPMLRFPRLLKVQTFWECYTRLDAIAKAPHFVRVFKTCTYMLFMIHIQSCAFYAFSEFEKSKGIYNEWVYNDQGNAYIRCFYFATKTATSIGNNPTPQNINEFMYMTLAWLMGVFVFALLIGQVRDIFQASRMMKTEYRKTMDITTNYMQNLKVPNELQDRVKLWFNYNWEQQKTLNENAALDILPLKMRTDLAINVHYQTLIKVQLFQGDVGHEMYIVNNGQVQVMGGEKNDIVLATLHSGSVFGEISLLSLAGGNRRTADVRSRGFSNLFILSKNDLQEAIKDYPDAQDALKRRAKKIMAQNAKRERKPSLEEEVEVKPGTHNTPRMVSAVIQAMDKNPEIHFREVTQILTGRKSRTSSTLPPQLSMDRQSSVEQHPSPDGSNTGGTDELLVVETTQQGSKQSTQISIRQSLNQETAERRSRLSKMRSINENVDDKTGACEEQHADSAIENTTSPNSFLDEAEQNAGGYMDVKIKNTPVPENDPNGPGSQESGISVDELHEKGTRKDRRSGKERLGIKTRVAPLTKREQGKDDWDASVDSSSELGATEESQPSSATMSALQQQMWQKRASLFQAKSSLEEPIVTENTASPYQKVASENKNEAGKGENFSNPTSQQGRIVSPPPNHGRGDVSVLTSKPARKSSPSASQKAGDVSVPTSQQARKFSPPNSQSGGDASVSAVQQGQRVSHPTSQNGGEVSSPASRQVRKVSPSAQGEAVSATPRPVQRQPTYELPLPCHSELILTPKSLMSLDREASVLSRSLSMQDRAVSTSSSLMSASFDFEDESNIALHPADGHQGGHMSPDRLSKCSSCSGGLDNLGYLPESDSSETVHINETSC
ncbi:PREDICTED: cGMP-gated cation channel alpha-1-like isoform X2 [Priapulus caudatus]|uniref:cGMP-gated cation channel alpha-1-like isoform X2 n=1 Tax=Priapulus caudatus TaxID=37621 RepID=A0ABM1E3W8_PRICU|nr:PREDICTED: cGMP-gated cation channel alpha-1-like isoform X2 [Priapulus caudatus]